MCGVNLGNCFEKLQQLVCSRSSEFSPYREKVAEELLLCEVMVQYTGSKHNEKHLFMRVPCSSEKLLSLRGSRRQTSSTFRLSI
jgi:hypothetical protein